MPQFRPLTASISLCVSLADQAGSLVSRNLRRVRLPQPPARQSHPQPLHPSKAGHAAHLDELYTLTGETFGKQVQPQQQPTVVRRLRSQARQSLRPKGPGGNDRTMRERSINVLTSLPFMFVGHQTMRDRQTSEGRRFGATLVTVGVAASAYHAASGRLRTHLRKLDYWTIALSSTSMVKALFPQGSKALQASSLASLALTPFLPFVVSTVNTGIMEVEFARRALSHKCIRPAYRRHAVTAGAGFICADGRPTNREAAALDSQRRGVLLGLGSALLLLPAQQASAGFGWDGSSSAIGSCALGEAGDECRKAVLLKDKADVSSYGASSSATKATTATGVPVAEMSDEYTLATLELGEAIEKYASLDLYDPQRVKVIQLLKKDGAAWASKYARGGSARKLSARRFYISIDALQGHIASNGFAPFPKQKLAVILKNWEETKQLLAEGR
ncbi:hypothetical protein WJX72_000866 [[Myrmecia] bisecta]|uniref:Uncharacterized protein n=1 Tax=[Myrmecia] bisecta TaxID=41462 RepID=A0AAW1PE21_9CHLO